MKERPMARARRSTASSTKRGRVARPSNGGPVRGDRELLREAWRLLRAAELGTTRRQNTEDDDEDPTRRAGQLRR